MNWLSIVILISSGLLFVIIVIFAAESDRTNIKRRKTWMPRLTKLYSWHRNRDQLLAPPDHSVSESKTSVPDPYQDHKQAFDLLQKAEGFDELLSYKPSSTRLWIWDVLRICLGIILITLAIVGQSKHDAAFGLVILGAIPLAIGLYNLLKLGDSPLKCLPAIIQNKSDSYYAGDYMANWGAALLVCIETNDGDTKHYSVNLRLFKKIGQHDIGIAYVKGDQMLDFKKVSLKER